MGLSEKILVLENRIIDFLTMITWWIEVRFEKTNVTLGVWVSTIQQLLFVAVFSKVVYDMRLKGVSGFIIGFYSLEVFAGGMVFLIVIFFGQIVEKAICTKYPQDTPNPARISKEASYERRTYACLFLAFVIFTGLSFTMTFNIWVYSATNLVIWAVYSFTIKKPLFTIISIVKVAILLPVSFSFDTGIISGLTGLCFLRLLFCFILACDSIPPAEKARRKARNEALKLRTQHA